MLGAAMFALNYTHPGALIICEMSAHYGEKRVVIFSNFTQPENQGFKGRACRVSLGVAVT
jgi:hypothetical protein